MATLAERFATAKPSAEFKLPERTESPLTSPPPDPGVQRVTRKVNDTGRISVSYQYFSVGYCYADELVDVDVKEHTLDPWLKGKLIKTVLRTSTGR